MHQDRRLAAILAADVAGYSRLMSGDEAGTLARFKQLRLNVIDPAKSVFEQYDKSLANDQEVPCIEASPGIDAQDYDETELARSLELTEAIDGDNATVTARFTLFPGSADESAKREMRWSLKQIDGAWLVADIESVSNGWKLSDIKCELSN